MSAAQFTTEASGWIVCGTTVLGLLVKCYFQLQGQINDLKWQARTHSGDIKDIYNQLPPPGSPPAAPPA